MNINNSSKCFQYFYICDPAGGNLPNRLMAELEGAVPPEQTVVNLSQFLLNGGKEQQRDQVQHVCPLSGSVSSEADGKCSLDVKIYQQRE